MTVCRVCDFILLLYLAIFKDPPIYMLHIIYVVFKWRVAAVKRRPYCVQCCFVLEYCWAQYSGSVLNIGHFGVHLVRLKTA